MTRAAFGSGWTGRGDNGFDLAVSGDGQAITLTFAEIEADVDAGKSPELFAARVFSAVLPIDGDGAVDIAFRAQGFAAASKGATAYAVLSVNGQSTVLQFSGDTDESFLQQLIVANGPASPCHLVVVAVVERDPAYPDAAATLRPSTVDAEIQPSG